MLLLWTTTVLVPFTSFSLSESKSTRRCRRPDRIGAKGSSTDTFWPGATGLLVRERESGRTLVRMDDVFDR